VDGDRTPRKRIHACSAVMTAIAPAGRSDFMMVSTTCCPILS
jgi:hypothetical protein